MKIFATKINEISEEDLQKVIGLVHEEKKIKIQKLKYKKDKVRVAVGYMLIRNIIKDHLNINDREIVFQLSAYGKPFLKNYANFNFNISHAGDFVVCAIDNNPIGIDIEKIIPIEYKSIADNFFTAVELDYIMRENLRNQLSKFYEIWTIKESYVKAYGQGLNLSFKAFSVDYKNREDIKVTIGNKYDKCYIRSFDLESDYKVAVCSFNQIILKDIAIIDQGNLVSNFLCT